jgi:hypothetical protein
MKKLFITLLSLCSVASFAQNGFFLQPEIGTGFSNTSWRPSSSVSSYDGQKSVFSYQGQVDIGYKAGKWQFITGFGYLRTGVKLSQGTIADFNNYALVFFENASFTQLYAAEITDYNPHYVIPVKIGYEVHRFSKKLSLTPLIGAEFTNNLPRTFVFTGSQKEKESKDDFTYNCNKYGVTGLVQLNFDYRINNRYDLSFGPSAHYMFTSELNFKDQHDYAVLMNLGLKWSFKSRKQVL